MEIAAFVVAVLATLAAGASALYARGANARADTANQRATDALELQRRIDERAREFVEIEWELAANRDVQSNRFSMMRLTNVGLTTAVGVTVVIEADEFPRELRQFEKIGAGEAVTFSSDAAAHWMEKYKTLMPLRPGFRVHWSTPLGNRGDESFEHSAILQIG